jgi:hypothetical protein
VKVQQYMQFDDDEEEEVKTAWTPRPMFTFTA